MIYLNSTKPFQTQPSSPKLTQTHSKPINFNLIQIKPPKLYMYTNFSHLNLHLFTQATSNSSELSQTHPSHSKSPIFLRFETYSNLPPNKCTLIHLHSIMLMQTHTNSPLLYLTLPNTTKLLNASKYELV